MPRNIRWDESVKENVLNLVEALLSQADDELDDLELKAAVCVEWVTQNKLRVTGKEKQKRGKREKDVELGTKKEHLVKLVEKAGKSLKLPKQKEASGSSQLEEVQTALDCLKELGVREDQRSAKNQGYWKFALTLKHQTATREENLEVVQQKWKEHPKTNLLVTSPTTPTLKTGNSIDWRNICRAMLEKQKRLTTNELLSADEDMKFELDEIHVPLALVQRTKPDKRSGDVFPEQGSRLYEPSYEETQRFKHEDFLAQVLQQGKGQSKGRRIALIGEPGAGKTTLLQAIAFWLLEDKNKDLGLPIWISLADLQGKTLEEYLLQRWLKNALEVVRVTPEHENALVELFKNNRVWLFLDGVDEIVAGSVGVGGQSFAPLQIIASHLEGWVAKARVVLSCRLNVWEANLNALGDDFEKYRLLDFDYPEQVKEFIDRWFAKTDADKGERLWAELDKSERQRIQDLVKNPLRLALLCSTYNPDSPSLPYQGGSNESFSSHQGESNESLSSHQGITKDSLSSSPYQGGARGGNSGLPSTKAGLYQRFLQEFYKWKENRFPTTEEQQEELNAALGRLAKRAIDQEASRFRLRHKLVREELGDPKQQGSLFWLALQLGWLNQVGLAAESETQEKVYAFFHPTFQEYFAALAIADWDFFLNHVPHNPAQGIYRIFEPQWKEIILLWLGRENVEKDLKEEFIKTLVNFEDKCKHLYGGRAYLLAADGIEEFLDCELRANIFAVMESPIDETHEIDEVAAQKLDAVCFRPGAILGGMFGWLRFPLDLYYPHTLLKYLGFNRLNLADIRNLESNSDALIQMLSVSSCELTSTINIINKSNNVKILIQYIDANQNIFISRAVIKRLLEIARRTPTTLISTLLEGHYSSSYEDIYRLLAWLLGEIPLEELESIKNLISLLKTSRNDLLRQKAAQRLAKVTQCELLQVIVKKLRECIVDEVGIDERTYECDLIWHCAQNMTYPAFYQAWHQQEEVEKTTTPDRQSLNQADLPQSLQSAIANDPQLSQSIHLICIDGSQFIEPDRPAAEIYDQMLDQNCPECNSVPETMPALKLYWNSLKRNSNKHPVLVFYASSTEPYSEAFLTDLSKFGGAICVVTSPPTPLLQGEGSKNSSGSPSSPWGEGVRGWGSLQLFAPSQASANLLEWIRENVGEE